MTTEMKVTHTPGPWTFYAKLSGSENHRGFKLVSQEFLIGDLIPFDEDGIQGKANAHLIAAAPDMLEALEYFAGLENCDQGTEPCSHDSGPYCSTHGDNFLHQEKIKQARAAIAKAKGGAA